jgi:hypothetical protein
MANNESERQSLIELAKLRGLPFSFGWGVEALKLAIAPTLAAVASSAMNAGTGVLFPLYFALTDGYTDVQLLALLLQVRLHPRIKFIIIFNKANGYGTFDANIDVAIKQLNAAGAICIGYMDTAYGARDANLVIAESKLWLNYTGIKGWFLDQIGATSQDYTKALRFTLEADPTKTIVFNPGIPLLSSWYDQDVFGKHIFILSENSVVPTEADQKGYINTHLNAKRSQRGFIFKNQGSLITGDVTTTKKYSGWIGWSDNNLFNNVPASFAAFCNLIDA